MKILQLSRWTFAVFVAGILIAQSAPAQRLGPPPKRPKASAVTDTNDARQYLDYATTVFDKDPSASAAGFYWAARIDPTSAAALYGRSMALVLSNRTLLSNFFANRQRDTKEQRAVDSLRLRALMIDPFLHSGLAIRLFKGAFTLEGGANLEDQFYLESALRTADPFTRALLYYSEREFGKALQQYADAMKTVKEKAGVRIERGRIFALISQPDSAIAEFNLALDELRKRDKKDVVVFYNSKAVIEHSIGTLHERAQKTDAAKESYGRALQEDLSYYPAHMRLGLLAIDSKDTTTALSELELAAQIAVDEPQVHFVYGFALSQFGKHSDAIKELTKATTLEPYYARPYVVLGQVLETTGDKSGAAAAYTKFLQYASQQDGDRPMATQKRDALGKSQQ